jgi:hypothetical protein
MSFAWRLDHTTPHHTCALVGVALVLVGGLRVEFGDHITAQVTAGGVSGLIVGGLPCWLLTQGL